MCPCAFGFCDGVVKMAVCLALVFSDPCCVCLGVGHTAGLGLPWGPSVVGCPSRFKGCRRAVLYCVVKGSEPIMDRDPLSGHAPIIRGDITCRGARGNIGQCPRKFSHPSNFLLLIHPVSCRGQWGNEGKAVKWVDVKGEGGMVRSKRLFVGDLNITELGIEHCAFVGEC